MYDAVYSQYGPFYYAFMDAVLSVLRMDVSHDAGRFITVGIWTATSLLCGLVMFGLTRRLWIGCAVQLLTALTLDTLRPEPMHPGGLICLVVAGIAAVTPLMPTRPRLAWTALGALGAALATTKINVGVFALLAIGLVALGAFATTLARRVLLAIAGVFVVASPTLLMMSHFELPSVPRFILHVTAALLPLVLLETIRPTATFMRSNGIAWMSCSAIATFLVLSAYAMLHGTTLRGLVNVLFIAPLRHPDVLFRPLELAPHSRKLALLAAIAGIAAVLWNRSSRSFALLRILAGLAMWLAVPGILPIRLGFYFAPLAWVAALPVPGIPDSPALAFARRFLPLLAVLQTLHAYPVARSHVQWGAFLLVSVGAICMFDGARQLGRSLAVEKRPLLAHAGVVVLLLLAALLAMKTLASSKRVYFTNEPLRLPRSQHVRLPPIQASHLRHVVRMLQDHDCATFIGAPGMGSFYFWARREPPTALIATRWGYLFNWKMQQNVVRDIEHVDNLCVVERGEAITSWARESAVHPSPLADYLQRHFVPAGRAGIYRLRLRNVGHVGTRPLP